jgi:hypothetical protein
VALLSGYVKRPHYFFQACIYKIEVENKTFQLIIDKHFHHTHPYTKDAEMLCSATPLLSRVWRMIKSNKTGNAP